MTLDAAVKAVALLAVAGMVALAFAVSPLLGVLTLGVMALEVFLPRDYLPPDF